MRLLHIIGTMEPASGGPAEAVRMLLDYAPPGIVSEVATLDPPGARFLNELPCAAHGFGKSFTYNPEIVPWLRTNRHRFDAAIVHGLWKYPTVATWLAFRGSIPYAVFPHGMLDPYFNRSRLKYLKKLPYWLAIERFVLRDAHRVLFTTAAERDLAARSFPLSRWTPEIFPLGTRPPSPITAEVREALPSAVRGQRFLLFLGRIDPKKGCDLLLHAFAQHSSLDPGLHLVMAGPDPGNWRGQLTRNLPPGIANRVHWPGMLTGNAKSAALSLCEAFILPSHQENFGIAVVEALAYGRPVLLSDKINIAAEIAADGCGLVGPDTEPGTAQLLIRWYQTSPAMREAMSAQARATFERRYNMQRNAAALLDIFPATAPRREAR